MAISIKIPIDPNRLSKEMSPSNDLRSEIMLIVGNAILATIGEKTFNGKDADGNQFATYTPEYTRRKKRMGRHPGTEGDWLVLTGAMMGDLQIVEHDKNRVVVGFSTPLQAVKAYAHSRAGAGKKKVVRDFMGVSDESIEEIERNVTAHLGREGL